MTIQSYNIDQLNAVAKSYQEEINKLLEIKANNYLTIIKKQTEINELKSEITKKDKLIAELESKIKENAPS